MHTAVVILNIVLLVAVIGLTFLVLGALRVLGVMGWKLEQIEVISPRRIGRDGLPLGRNAPDFTLPGAVNGSVSLLDFAGRKRLIVFTQSGCRPCHDIIPELNRVQDQGRYQVLVVNNASADETRAWAADVKACFPVLTQDKWEISKQYEVFATPFAFVIDENGVVASKGLVGTRKYLDFVLNGVGRRGTHRAEVNLGSTNAGTGETSMRSEAGAQPRPVTSTSERSVPCSRG
jgi:methylamine dehydrogenase accessory protein MauD